MEIERFLGALVGDGGEGVCFLEVQRDGERLRVVVKLDRDGGIRAVLLGKVDSRGRMHSVKMRPFVLTAEESDDAFERIEAMQADIVSRARKGGM